MFSFANKIIIIWTCSLSRTLTALMDVSYDMVAERTAVDALQENNCYQGSSLYIPAILSIVYFLSLFVLIKVQKEKISVITNAWLSFINREYLSLKSFLSCISKCDQYRGTNFSGFKPYANLPQQQVRSFRYQYEEHQLQPLFFLLLNYFSFLFVVLLEKSRSFSIAVLYLFIIYQHNPRSYVTHKKSLVCTLLEVLCCN